MAGMEGLGRVLNVVPIASAKAISMKQCSGVTFVCTGADTFSLTIATTFGGTYRAGSFFTPNWTPLNHVYRSSATDGTAAWTRLAVTAADNTGAMSAGTTVIELFGSQLPDTYCYVKCTAAATGLVAAIVHDLTVARKPANLALLGA